MKTTKSNHTKQSKQDQTEFLEMKRKSMSK